MVEKLENVMNLDVHLKSLGISIIAAFNNQTEEIFFIYFDKMDFAGIFNGRKREMQFAINHMSIDNNYYQHSRYPTVLSSKKSTEHKNYFFNIHVIQNITDNLNLLSFDLIQLEIKPLYLSLEDILIQVVFQLWE